MCLMSITQTGPLGKLRHDCMDMHHAKDHLMPGARSRTMASPKRGTLYRPSTRREAHQGRGLKAMNLLG